MREYLTEAVVLDREQVGEQDSKIFLFTKELGKIAARGLGTKKITSKLSSHLEPLSFIQVRLVEKNAFHIADALKLPKTFPRTPRRIELFHVVNQLTAPHHPDNELWAALITVSLDEKKVLMLLGYDPRHAHCANCNSAAVQYFSAADASYYCESCAPPSERKNFFKLNGSTGSPQVGNGESMLK